MPIDIVWDLERFLPIFQHAHDLGINEAETSARVIKFFEDALDYSFTEISREHGKGKNIGYAVKLDNNVKFFIEVKQAGTALKEEPIEQPQKYGAYSGVPWVLRTNGMVWQLYYLNFEEDIESDLVLHVDLRENRIKEAAQMLGMLHRKSVLKGDMEEFYEKMKTLPPRRSNS